MAKSQKYFWPYLSLLSLSSIRSARRLRRAPGVVVRPAVLFSDVRRFATRTAHAVRSDVKHTAVAGELEVRAIGDTTA